MAHKHIRKFNSKDTYPEQNLDNDLCQAVVARGTMVFLRGQCPQNLDDAKNIDSHDPVEQTHKVMQNIRQLIEEAGGKMEHLVKVVVYLTDIRHREAVYRAVLDVGGQAVLVTLYAEEAKQEDYREVFDRILQQLRPAPNAPAEPSQQPRLNKSH